MDKVLIELIVPAVNNQYEVFLPKYVKIEEICQLLGTSLIEMSNYMYKSSGNELLTSVEHNCILKYDKSLQDYRIQNGEHLVFM